MPAARLVITKPLKNSELSSNRPECTNYREPCVVTENRRNGNYFRSFLHLNVGSLGFVSGLFGQEYGCWHLTVFAGRAGSFFREGGCGVANFFCLLACFLCICVFCFVLAVWFGCMFLFKRSFLSLDHVCSWFGASNEDEDWHSCPMMATQWINHIMSV